jgi:phage repressor protein C with HTH and peptisase S24 domain
VSEKDLHLAQGKRLAAARTAAGYRSAREAALANSWPESTYRAHETGNRTIGLDDAERYARRFRARGADVTAQQILFGEGLVEEESVGAEQQRIPIMGYVGAGGDVEPDYEQVPHDGLDQIEIPYVIGIVGDPIGFEIRGDSNQPKYSAGEVVIVEREQPWATESMIGDFAVIRTYDGHRYLKKIMPGGKPHLFDLISINAPEIRGVRIAWASPIRMVIPRIGTRKVPLKRRSATKSAGSARKSPR